MFLYASPPLLFENSGKSLPKGVFVTGTDTNIGKTLVSALLLKAWHGIYWKPVQTGLAQEMGDTEKVAQLTGLPASHFLPPAYALQAPLSPYAAAREEAVEIDPARLVPPAHLPPHALHTGPLIMEGAGGVMVPVTRNMAMIDLIAQSGLPVLLVTRSGLGTLNHTVLTFEALYNRKIPVLGFVMNGEENPENLQILEETGSIPCLFTLPPLYPTFTNLSSTSLSFSPPPPTEKLISMIDDINVPSWEDCCNRALLFEQNRNRA